MEKNTGEKGEKEKKVDLPRHNFLTSSLVWSGLVWLCLCSCASVLRLCPALRGCGLRQDNKVLQASQGQSGPVNFLYSCHVTADAPFLSTVLTSGLL